MSCDMNHYSIQRAWCISQCDRGAGLPDVERRTIVSSPLRSAEEDETRNKVMFADKLPLVKKNTPYDSYDEGSLMW